MNFDPASIAAILKAIADGTASFEARASLEHELLTVLKAEGNERFATLVASLPGHEFGSGQQGQTPGAMSFHSPKSGYPQLVVETFENADIVSVNVSVRAGEETVPEPDPRHQVFYEVWERLLGEKEPELDTLEPWPKVVYLVGLLESEVMNGGVGQYLTNTDGRSVHATLACLEQIGAAKTAAVLRAAWKIGKEADSFAAAWESNSAAFEELDERFLESGEDLAALSADRFVDCSGAVGG